MKHISVTSQSDGQILQQFVGTGPSVCNWTPALCVSQYDPRFCDAFWNSGKYNMVSYLLRMMTSWAIVVNVWYLPPMTIQVSDTSSSVRRRTRDYTSEAYSPRVASNCIWLPECFRSVVEIFSPQHVVRLLSADWRHHMIKLIVV